MGDMPILCDSRTPKGNSGSWTTHGSTYCKAGHTLYEGEDECHSQGKEAQLGDILYKYHTLADYPKTIRMFGTADNYNMQIVCPSFSWDFS